MDRLAVTASRSLVIASLVVLAACSSTSVASQTATGAVVGGIRPCAGPPLPNGPQYVAGTVTAYAGSVTYPAQGPAVMPSKQVAQQSVQQNATYRFVLAPGPYVLVAQLVEPANIRPFVSVTVTAGQTISADIPNICR